MADYNEKEVEEKLKKFWENKKIYRFKPSKKVYAVDTPPPTVSGKMHIGHAFSYSQQDFIVRFRRMFNGNVFYPFGTDDNGLPTERLVEKLNNVKSKQMSRAEFIELCLKTLKKITPDFIQDWKNIGISCDYNLMYSTIDSNSRKLSQSSFIKLFNEKRVYKKEFPTIWCPECQTAIAQAELEDKEKTTLFTTIKFTCEGKPLLIATTRPELLGACVAVFVNPEDKRYTKLVGKKAKVPLTNHEVLVIADKSAEIEKGTGVLMICSYGDKFDAEAINRHNLKPKIILNKDGTLNAFYLGLKIKEARKKVLEDLKKENLIVEQKEITHVVNVHDKCGTEIEFLPTEQWFIKILDLKQKMIEQGKKINWKPEFMFKRYENWVAGLEWDWSISRDRHFGIPIPAWHCRKCNKIIMASEKELPIDPLQTEKKCLNCNEKAEPETKVLDTWVTSSISPQIASSLTGNKIKVPYSLRPQAHDIIRTWAFYTIIRSYLSETSVPWENIMISGFVTLGGEKMSKSKGNVINPQEVLEKFGADALRFWAAGSRLGEDLDYQEKDLVAGKKFVTKLWNANQFIFMNLKDYTGKKPKKLEKVDELFLRKLNSLVKICTESFENCEYNRAKTETEKLFWQFCDNYLEIVKNRVYNATGDKKVSAQYTLYKALITILKVIAPIMPFITEEIYQTYFKKQEKDESIHTSSWPEFEKEQKADELDIFYALLAKVRHEKSIAQKSMKAEIQLTIDKKDLIVLEKSNLLEDFKAVVSAKEVLTGSFGVKFLS